MRNRTGVSSASGSMWMSVAPMRTASWTIVLRTRTTGESSKASTTPTALPWLAASESSRFGPASVRLSPTLRPTSKNLFTTHEKSLSVVRNGRTLPCRNRPTVSTAMISLGSSMARWISSPERARGTILCSMITRSGRLRTRISSMG